MLLKAGTYRFNDVVDTSQNLTSYFSLVANGDEFLGITVINRGMFYLFSEDDGESVYSEPYHWDDFPEYQTHTITKDTEVDEHFGNWYIVNTNYNEVNPTVDTIYTEKSSWYKSVADAIRNKKGTSEPINRDDFASEISSISVGEEVPYYDGTVIIEKAESVLGLRRIKDSWFTNYIANVGEFDKSSQTEMQNVYNQYGFEIEPTALTLNGITATLLGLTATFAYIESDVLPNTTTWVGKINLNGSEMYVTTDNSTFTDILTQFTVTATPNSTVDEWLLANTEEVSV